VDAQLDIKASCFILTLNQRNELEGKIMSEARKIKVVDTGEEELQNSSHASGDAAQADGAPADVEPNGAGQPAAPESPQDAQAKLEAKEKECQETHDRLLRVTADYENYKKRMSREMEDFRKYANQSLLKEILSVIDHIELAIQAADAPSGTDTRMVEGLHLTLKEFLRILEKFNVKPIEAVGQPFDPQMHEAILREACDRFPKNTVVREMQKGYTIHNRLLRPSLVVVAAPRGIEPDSTTEAC
jgi:molecular chaperone GrpE